MADGGDAEEGLGRQLAEALLIANEKIREIGLGVKPHRALVGKHGGRLHGGNPREEV